MLILWIFVGAALFYYAQSQIYAKFWSRGLSARLSFGRESAVEGEECQLLQQVENRKALPLPMLKVKFQLSRRLKFGDEGDSAVTDQYYRNDILSLGPNQRVTRKISFRCAARGYYRINGMDLVCSDLLLTREWVKSEEEQSTLYVYPRPAQGIELMAAVRKLNGEILAKRHLLDDPFEYRGIREYAPFDEMKTINWKATARMDSLMVNMKGYTSLRAVRIFVNLDDNGILRYEDLLEMCIRVAVRFVSELLEQGMRVSVYCNGKDCLTGEAMAMLPGAGVGHMESINRSFARLDLGEKAYPFADVFRKELEEDSKDTATIFVSVERGEEFQEQIGRFAASRADFAWFVPLYPRMDLNVEEPGRLHLIRLNAEEMLDE